MAISPVKTPTDTTNTSIEQLAAQRLGLGVARVDPTTGQQQSYTPGQAAGALPTPATPSKTPVTVVGSDGKKYYTYDGKSFNLAGSGSWAPLPAGVSASPGAATTGHYSDTGNVDPSFALQSGIAGAAGLDPARNAALQAAGVTANRLAGGYVGDQLAAPVQAGINATQGRINSQAQDLGVVRASANGTGPSAAENLAKSQLDSNIRSQAALAATARGGNVAAAMRQAAQSGTQQSLQSASTLNALRAQEQLNAQGVLTQGANNLTAAQGQVGNQQQNLQNMRGGLMQAGTTAQLGAAGQTANDLSNMTTAKQTAADQYAQYLLNQYSVSAGLSPQYSGQGVQAQIANQNNNTQLIGAALNSAGSALAAFTG